MSDEMHVDVAIAGLAARQHAMVATRQLESLGLSRAAIVKRVRAGRLTPQMRGVYRVGPFTPPLRPEMAALLACPGAVLSHQSAAFVLELALRPDEVHVIAPTQRRRREGLVVHRAHLRTEEIWDGRSLSLTSPFRTLSDLRHSPVFEKAVWEASYQRLVSDDEARTLLGRKAPRADHEGERYLVDLILQAGLPEPRTNTRIGRFEVDLYWPEHRLVVELDSRNAHGHELAKDRDARKQRRLEQEGIALVRVSVEELSEQPLKALASVARALP